jgi:hypothetical protein
VLELKHDGYGIEERKKVPGDEWPTVVNILLRLDSRCTS